MERDGSTPKGYELHIHAGDEPTSEIKAMVKSLSVEDGDVLLVRMAPGMKYRDIERTHDILRSVFKSLGLRAVALTAPADLDIERIPADKIPGLIELLQGLLLKHRPPDDSTLQAIDELDRDEAEARDPKARRGHFEATRDRDPPIQARKRGRGLRRGSHVAGE